MVIFTIFESSRSKNQFRLSDPVEMPFYDELSNVKVPVGASNKKEALVGAFSIYCVPQNFVETLIPLSTHHDQQPGPQGADVRCVRGEGVSGLVQHGGEPEAGGVVQQLRGGQVQPRHHRLQHQSRGGGGVVRGAGKIEIKITHFSFG